MLKNKFNRSAKLVRGKLQTPLKEVKENLNEWENIQNT